LLLGGGSAPAECVRPQHALIERGISPAGVPWRFKAGVSNNPTCNQSPLLSVDFRLGNPDIGYMESSSSGSAHISPSFPIDATDDPLADLYEAAMYGQTGGIIARLDLQMSNGETVTVRPNWAPLRLRRRYSWLRDVRFFAFFHPVNQLVMTASLYSKDGRLIYRAHSYAGDFF
jgi:hypothetical protein